MSSPAPWNWERYVPYLRCRARWLGLDRRLRVRFDESDLVGETLKKAWESHEQCRAATEGEQIAWLEHIQDHILIDRWRQANAGRRDINREQQLSRILQESSACWERILPADQPSPSSAVARQELVLQITAAIDELPPDQRDAVLAILVMDDTTQQAAERLDKSRGAVAGHYFRGVTTLRRKLQHPGA